jgi:hypothetical protein
MSEKACVLQRRPIDINGVHWVFFRVDFRPSAARLEELRSDERAEAKNSLPFVSGGSRAGLFLRKHIRKPIAGWRGGERDLLING